MRKQTPMFMNRRARRSGPQLIATYKGRPIRDENGHEGANGGGGSDNNGGNSGGANGSEANQNNNSNEPDYSAFWDQGAGDGTGSPESGSAGAGSPPAPQGQQQPQNQPSPIAQELGQQLAGMKFEALVTPEILESFGSGDPASFNEGLNGFGQAVARQTLGMTVGIMRHFREEIMNEMRETMGGEFQQRENFSDLVAAIPAAGKSGPASKTIQDIYKQALSRSKGNKQAAIQQTKDVMRLQAEAFGGDLGLDVAPRDAGGRSYSPPAKTNWLEELAGPK